MDGCKSRITCMSHWHSLCKNYPQRTTCSGILAVLASAPAKGAPTHSSNCVIQTPSGMGHNKAQQMREISLSPPPSLPFPASGICLLSDGDSCDCLVFRLTLTPAHCESSTEHPIPYLCVMNKHGVCVCERRGEAFCACKMRSYEKKLLCMYEIMVTCPYSCKLSGVTCPDE